MNDVLSMNRRRFMTLTGSALATLGGGHALAQGQKRLELNPTEFRPIPIAISNFVPGSPADGDVSNGVTQVITNNLKRSGLFAPIDQAAFIERISNIDVAPQFQNWKTINAQALVTGRMTRGQDGRLKAGIPPVGRHHGPAACGPAIFHLAGILAPYRPHHLRPDL
ncbi:hypothetical protein ACVWXQ_005107 [Bradyrhizobium sp. S3.14.4]